MMRRLCFAVCVFVATLSSPAVAQTNWPTAGGAQAQGVVFMCLDAQGRAVPATSAGTCLGSGGGGGSAVFGPTAAGSPAANPPVIIGGTSDGTATGSVTNWKIVSGIGYLNLAQVNAVTVLTGAGATGTGSQRVTVAQDATTVAGLPPGQALAAASAPVVLTAAQLSTLTPPTTVTANQGSAGASPWPVSLPTTPTLANGNGVVPTQGGAVLSATNGWFGNILQGNAVLSSGNPLFAQLTAGAAAIGSVTQSAGPANVTATDCSATVVTGNSAVNAFTAQTTLHGFTIANIDTTEVMWISFTTTASASGTGSYPLPAATATTFAGFGSFTAPPGFGLNHALSVVAATNGHKFTCTWW
jgi:hypothetical protein